MTDNKMKTPVLVLDDALAGGVSLPGLTVRGLSDFRMGLVPLSDGQSLALADTDVLGLCLSSPALSGVREDAPFNALLAAADIPLIDLGDDPDAPAALNAALGLALSAREKAEREAASTRAAAAELRRTHMQVQDDHAELETWVWDQLAPKFSVVREWPESSAVLRLPAGETLRQRLPSPARGFIAVDLILADSAPEGVLHASLERPVGPAFEGMEVSVTIPEGMSGPLRITMPHAGRGQPEDAVLALTFAPPETGAALPISLAPVCPFPDICAAIDKTPGDRPLAMRVYRTLPRMPAPPLHDPRLPLPAEGGTRLIRPSELGAPDLLPFFGDTVRRALRGYPDAPEVAFRKKDDSFLVQPSTKRPVVARVSGLEVERLSQISAFVQLGRHDTLEVAFALGVAPAGTVTSGQAALAHIGEWRHILPSEWGNVWCEPPEALAGKIDLFLVTAMPGMPFNRNADALFHGFRVSP